LHRGSISLKDFQYDFAREAERQQATDVKQEAVQDNAPEAVERPVDSGARSDSGQAAASGEKSPILSAA